MLLAPALHKSLHGIARRSRVKSVSQRGIERMEWHIAFVTDRGNVYAINGRTGNIHAMNAEDQARDDWEPFAPKVLPPKRKIKKI